MADNGHRNLDALIAQIRRGERSDGAIDALINTVQSLRHHADDAAAVRRILQASEEATRHALQTLEFHIDNSPMAVVEWNPLDGVSRWSAGAARMFGYESRDLADGDWRQRIIQNYSKVQGLFEQLLRGTLPRFACVTEARRKDGRIIHCQFHNSALTAEDGSIISVLSQAVELTERFEAEARMTESQRRLEFHIDNSPIAIMEWGPDFRWRRWSGGAQRIFGWTADEAIGQSFAEWDFIHEADTSSIWPQVQQMLAGELPRFSAVNRNVRKDGSIIWCEWHSSAMIDESGKVISVLSHATDITDRVTAEEGLRDTRHALEQHLDNSPVAIVEWGPDFKFRRWSRGAERIYGYTSEMMVGTNFETMDPPMIHPQDMPRAMAHVNLLLSGQSARDSIIVRNLRKDGSTVWMHWHGSSLYDEQGKLVSVLSQGIDISEQMAAEAKLRASESELRAAFDLTLVGMTQVDPATRRYISVNEEFCKITGYSAGELRQMDPFQLTHPDDQPKLMRQAEAVLRGETDQYVDTRRCIRKDGKVVWLHVAATMLRDSEGRPQRVIAAAIDITHRMNTEQALRESERRLALLVSNLPGMAYRCNNDRDWTMTFVSDRALDLTGYTAAEFIAGKTLWSQLLHPNESERIWSEVQAAVDQRRPFELEYRLRRRDGQWRWVWEQGQGVFVDDQLIALEGFITDVTERKVAEQELKSAKDRAEAASRAKDRFIASLSHELRTPLTPVRALLSVLRDDARLPADVRDDLQMVHRNVQIESRLIDDLLDITRLVRGDVEMESDRIDLHPMIRQAVENAAAGPDAKEHQLHTELNAVSTFIMGDSRRVQQVLWNVLGNAIKFTPSGGAVTIATDNPDPQTLRVTVTDTGIGIAAEHLPYIFEAFERGEAEHRYEYTGLGLGLAIARSLSERMKGTITAHSDGAGQGTTLTIKFPVAPPAAKLPAQKPAPPTRKSGGTQCAIEKVLLVEDHTATAEILARLISRDGAEVTVARSMDEALAVARSATFDLILSDIGLPGGTGNDLLRTLRDEGNQTPAIAISGYGMSSDIAASRAAGFSAHLTKPVDFDQLRNAISDVVSAT